MFTKALMFGQNLMAKGAVMLTDAAGDASDTLDKVEEGLSLAEKAKDWITSPNGVLTAICLVGGAVAVIFGVLVIKPAIRKSKKR